MNMKLLLDIFILLFFSHVIIIISNKIKLSPIIGYLLLGLFLNTFDLISCIYEICQLSELGINLLLFVIGLNLSLNKLLKLRLYILKFGILQVFITFIFFYFFFTVFVHLSFIVSVFLSLSLSLSSTAIVLQIISQNCNQDTTSYNISLSVLLTQDFLMIPLLTLIPLFNCSLTHNDSLIIIIHALLKNTIVIFSLIIFGKYFLSIFLNLTLYNCCDKYIHFLISTMIIIGISYFSLFIKISPVIISFIFGTLISETNYKTNIRNSILSLQKLFLSFFFINIGFGINIFLIYEFIFPIILVSLFLIFIKYLLFFYLCTKFNLSITYIYYLSLLLSQCSEFSFILFHVLIESKLIELVFSDFLSSAVIVTMITVPVLCNYNLLFNNYCICNNFNYYIFLLNAKSIFFNFINYTNYTNVINDNLCILNNIVIIYTNFTKMFILYDNIYVNVTIISNTSNIILIKFILFLLNHYFKIKLLFCYKLVHIFYINNLFILSFTEIKILIFLIFIKKHNIIY